MWIKDVGSQTTVESTANDVGAYAQGFNRSAVRLTAHTLGLPSLQSRRVEQIRDVKSEMVSPASTLSRRMSRSSAGAGTSSDVIGAN